MKFNRLMSLRNAFIVLTATCLLSACSTTEKSGGQGMVSVVAQNVVRIAGQQAIRSLSLTELDGIKCTVVVSGFADDFNRGYVENLIKNEVEENGGKLVNQQYAEYVVDVGVNAAGNDKGASSYIVGGAQRTEGSVDLTVTVRSLVSGDKMSSQTIRGEAKYQQGSILGITGSGAYFVKSYDSWIVVDDPATFRP